MKPISQQNALIDPFGRTIDYLRISVTDRCDFRCVYCMAEEMTFTPKTNLLTLEELAFVGEVFINLGVKKIRITGGEPLVRKDLPFLLNKLSQQPKLKDFAITTNGNRLTILAEALKASGVQRLNVSLDTLDKEKFSKITRTGQLDNVLAGIDKAREYHFKKIKINAVILRGHNDDEVADLTQFAIDRSLDISFIEEMPLGNISSHQREDTHVSSDEIRNNLEEHWQLIPSAQNTGGPSRYWHIPNTQTKVGFISPHSHNFCGDCNRLRLTAEGRLLMCLGNEHSIDLREIIRQSPGDVKILSDAIIEALKLKPETHHFNLSEEPDIVRFMNTTGG